MAAKHDEVPNWVKTRLIEDARIKGPGQESIPKEILQVADTILLDECRRGLEMDSKSVSALLCSLIDIHDEEAALFNQDAQKRHLERLQQLKADGSLTEKELEQVANRTPSQVPVISKEFTDKKLQHIVSRFMRQWGYSLYRQDRPSKHLSREHPSMKALAAYINSLKEEKKVDSRLMFNWDQVWTCCLAQPIFQVLQ